MSKLSRIEGLGGFLSFDARTLRYFSRVHGLWMDNDNDKKINQLGYGDSRSREIEMWLIWTAQTLRQTMEPK